MKKLIALSIISLVWVASLFCTNYYSRGSSPTYYINNVSSWRTNRDGSGTSPANFTTAGQVFYVQNTHAMTATAKWTVSGTGSYVIVENGGTITTGAYDHQITGTVKNGGTYEVTHDTYGNLGWGGNGLLETTSNFVINPTLGSINFNDNVSYGNLIVKAGIADCSGSTTGFEVKGTLIVDGGIFEGAQTTEDQVLSIANIEVKSGYFYGSDGGANATFNMTGGITVSGGTFLGSSGSGICTYNIGGNLLISSGAFYGSFRNSSPLASNVYNITGSFTKTGGYYYAVNRIDEGYPTFNLTGTGKNLGLGDVSSDVYAHHSFEVASGASYTLTNNVPLGASMQGSIRGTVDASSFQFKATGASTVFRIYGTLKTPNASGLCWGASTTFANTNNPTVDLWAGTECTVEYTSASAQVITARTDYRNLTLSGAGTKTISGATTAATAFTIGAPLTVSATTISSGSMAVNAAVAVTTGITLNINGSMSGSSTISGGNVVIGGSGSQLQLRSLNVNNLTLNSTRGSLMYANVQTVNLILSQGTFNISAYTLTITGDMTGVGTLSGGNTSNLTLSGAGGNFTIPSGLVLNMLTSSRGHGSGMGGNLTLVNLSLPSGYLSVGGNTLTVSGSMSWVTGTLNTVAGSRIVMDTGAANGTIYPISSGILTINRSGRTCYLGGNTTLNTLNLNAGTLAIGAYTLIITDGAYANGGSFLGGATSNLTVNASATSVTIPAVTLGTYTQLNDMVNLTGNLEVNNLSLQTGTLNLGNAGVTIMQNSVIPPDKGVLPVISGTTSSSINYYSTSSGVTTLPEFNVGNLNVNSAGTCKAGYASAVSSQISLLRGLIDPNGLLTLKTGVLITRMNGSFTSAPSFTGGHQINYMTGVNTGWELPATPHLITGIMIMGGGAAVKAMNDVYLSLHLQIGPNCTFNMNGYTLYLEPGALVTGDSTSSLFGNVEKDIGSLGFSVAAAGLNIAPGVEISNFSCDQQPASQYYGENHGILRTWSLHGSFSGSVSLSLSWDTSADNGILFSPLNRAIVYCKVGESWQQVGDPQDVSMIVPRTITVNTTHFSEWTVGSEESTLPVELSSFTAVVTDFNAVTLTWITQSESNLLGYYLFRNTEADLGSALRISGLIAAQNSSSAQVYSFTDTEDLSQNTYYYWLQSMEMNGGEHTYNYVQVNLNSPNDPYVPSVELPYIQTYPNPFNPMLNIRITQPANGDLCLSIYDVRGRKLKEIFGGYQEKGIHDYQWLGDDETGKLCASGIYILHCKSDNTIRLQKIALLK